MSAQHTSRFSRLARRTYIGLAAAAASALVIVGCGGGGSASPSGTAGPMAVTSTSGVITGFGSVIVNGKEYATGATTQVVDGDNDDAASSTVDLKVGMVADIDADESGGTAKLLRFKSVVRGEVDAVGSSDLTVLGQTVKVTSGTSFSGARTTSTTPTPISALGDVHKGDYVVVYGYLECTTDCKDGLTNVIATLVHEPASAGKYRVAGYVGGYNKSATTISFNINGLTVDIATSTVCNPSDCALADGDFVVVRSTKAPGATSPLTITADDITKRREAPTFAVGSTVEIEGAVAQLDSTGTKFVVRGVAIDASGLKTLPKLANGQIVEVTGTILKDGTLSATDVTVERYATLMLMAPLDSPFDAKSTSLSVLGQVFTVNSSTRFADRAKDVRPFNSTNFATVLSAGDQLIVSGYSTGSGNVATRVERIPTPKTPIVAAEGLVTAATAPTSLTLDGVTASVGASTKLSYPGAGMTPTLTGFFSAIKPGASVALVVGTPGTNNTITADKAMVLGSDARWSGPE